jgi:lipopolysaccharide transport system permease protein
LAHGLNIVWFLILRDLKIRYKGKGLGFFWSLGNPLAFAIVYWFAFSVVFRVKEDGYFPFVLSGLFAWNFLSASINNSTASIVNNFYFIKGVRVNPSYFPIAAVGSEAVHFLISSMLLVVFLILFGILDFSLLWILSYFILASVSLLLLCSLGVVLSIVCVFIRDVQYLVTIFLQMMFFLAPVVYPSTLVPSDLRSFYFINPAAQYIELWRSVLIEGTFPINLFFMFSGFAIAMFLLSVVVFQRYRRVIADYA